MNDSLVLAVQLRDEQLVLLDSVDESGVLGLKGSLKEGEGVLGGSVLFGLGGDGFFDVSKVLGSFGNHDDAEVLDFVFDFREHLVVVFGRDLEVAGLLSESVDETGSEGNDGVQGLHDSLEVKFIAGSGELGEHCSDRRNEEGVLLVRGELLLERFGEVAVLAAVFLDEIGVPVLSRPKSLNALVQQIDSYRVVVLGGLVRSGKVLHELASLVALRLRLSQSGILGIKRFAQLVLSKLETLQLLAQSLQTLLVFANVVLQTTHLIRMGLGVAREVLNLVLSLLSDVVLQSSQSV